MSTQNETPRRRPGFAGPGQPTPAGDEALIGTQCGRVTVVDKIARGGFGTVYKAHDADKGLVGLKVLHAEMAQFPDAVARFQREAEAVNLICHRNVVEIFDFGTLADGRPYFTMEYLLGEDLYAKLSRVGRLPAKEITELLVPLCDALAAAHAAGVVHRDVKASNVFLVSDPEPRVVLLDFGIAKILNDDASLTSSRHALGTPTSMAPEQIRGEGVDERTDVYALGGLVYLAATGELPFHDPSAVVTHHMHLFAERPRPSAIVPDCACLDALVLRAMARDPAERFASVDALLAAAKRAVGGPSEIERGTGVAIYLERVLAGDEFDVAALDAAEEAFDECRGELEDAGMALAMDAGNAVLLISDVERVEPVLERALAAAARWQIPRPGVHLNICLGVGSYERVGDEYTDGELLRVDSWVPREAIVGLACPRAVAESRGLESESGEGAFARLLSPRE